MATQGFVIATISGVGMAMSTSVLKRINNLGAHRVGDVVSEMCGVGMTVSGSPNTTVG